MERVLLMALSLGRLALVPFGELARELAGLGGLGTRRGRGAPPSGRSGAFVPGLRRPLVSHPARSHAARRLARRYRSLA